MYKIKSRLSELCASRARCTVFLLVSRSLPRSCNTVASYETELKKKSRGKKGKKKRQSTRKKEKRQAMSVTRFQRID